jgi:hypothetical protein
LIGLALPACAARGFRAPEGPGEPFAGYAEAFASATAGCRDVRTLSAEAGVSGSVGGRKVRGRVIVGFERPGRIRLEGVAPIGPPAFILVADRGEATLLMPRASEVLTRQPPARVLEALVGVSLDPDQLLAILSGCVTPGAAPSSGRQYAGGWAAVELEGGSRAFMRLERGQWRVRAGLTPLVAVEYEIGDGGRLPQATRLRATANGAPTTDLRLSLAQVEINTPIAGRAFTVIVPAAAVPITLADLKQAGPLGDRR